jgi:hypothetical protein
VLWNTGQKKATGFAPGSLLYVDRNCLESHA